MTFPSPRTVSSWLAFGSSLVLLLYSAMPSEIELDNLTASTKMAGEPANVQDDAEERIQIAKDSSVSVWASAGAVMYVLDST
jgi:hypothetical protein